MDAISSLGSTASGTDPSSSVTPNAFSSLTSESFVKIIFSELDHQDPLQPSDSKDLLDQLSSLRNIQSSMDMSASLGSLVAQNELASAAGLIGKTISGVSTQGARVQGVVQSVTRTSSGATLNLTTGDQVQMSNMDQLLGGDS